MNDEYKGLDFLPVLFMLLAALFCICFSCNQAFAADDEKASEKDAETVQEVQKVNVTAELDPELSKTMIDVEKTLGDVSGKLDKLQDLNGSVDNVGENVKSLEDNLEGIESKIDGLLIQNADPEPKAVEKLTASNQTFNVYGNANPSNQYATYAKQLIPKMGWDDDYVFLQDSSSSYVLVWGNLDYYSAGTITGTKCNYTRWYYSGTGTGYLVQSGNGNVTINLGSYVVLSTLGQYPLLDDGITLLRQEVSFYAIAAAILWCLRSCFSFTLRMRSTVNS